MKIAHIVCVFWPYKGGMGNSVINLAKALKPHKHQVVVFTPNFKNSLEEEMIDGVKIIRLKPLFKIGHAAILPGLYKKLAEFDIIHLHYPFYGSAEIVAWHKLLNFKKTRLVVHYHMDTKGKGFKGIIFWIYKKIYLSIILRLADEITCASLDYVKHSDIGKYYTKNKQKFSQVSFGVNSKIFCQDKDFKFSGKNILFVGALDEAHYFKGVVILIKALKEIKNKKLLKDSDDLKLTIVGKGSLAPLYKKLVIKLDLENNINFVEDANDQDLVKYYQQTDIFVLPSINKSEAFGLVLLEAMASGKPVIASNLPGVRSVFKNKKQGFTVWPGDISDLAEKMVWLLSDLKKMEKMGGSARRLAELSYSWESAGFKLNEIYCRLRHAPRIKQKNNENSLYQ